MCGEVDYKEVELSNAKYVEKYSFNNYLKQLNDTYKKIIGE